LSSRIEPLGVSPAAATTSRDIGDVSCFVPSGGLAVTSYAYGLPIHSWPVVAATGTSIGTKTLITAAKAIVGTAVELYLDPQLLSAVENDWSRSRGTTAFSTPIPAEQKALANIRQSFRLEIPRKCNALFFHLDNYFQIKFLL
jgi:aminobenzoyl-glutamate utilization protein B